VDRRHQQGAHRRREARKLGIPVIAILDTNCDPDEVDYPIPGNDDAIRAVTLLTRVIADAVADGLMARAERAGDETRRRPPWRRAAGRVGEGAARRVRAVAPAAAEAAPARTVASAPADVEAARGRPRRPCGRRGARSRRGGRGRGRDAEEAVAEPSWPAPEAAGAEAAAELSRRRPPAEPTPPNGVVTPAARQDETPRLTPRLRRRGATRGPPHPERRHRSPWRTSPPLTSRSSATSPAPG
jgi:hypothetical protein